MVCRKEKANHTNTPRVVLTHDTALLSRVSFLQSTELPGQLSMHIYNSNPQRELCMMGKCMLNQTSVKHSS